MATLSVLAYNLPARFKMKTEVDENLSNSEPIVVPTSQLSTSSQLTKTFSKITVQNVLSESNGNSLNISNNNAIVRKIKDFGMFGSLSNVNGSSASKVTITARKRSITPNEDKSAVLVSKKLKISKESANTPKTSKKAKAAGTPGRKGLPLPQAVARRNARERNRVKQVNNGFAALRDRIPEEVAEAFEMHGSNGNRSAAKKLSKVETLRMAVEYIRSLERLLGFEFPIGERTLSCAASASGSESTLHSSPDDTEHDFSLIKDEFEALSPTIDEQFDDSLSNYDVDDYFGNTSGNNSDYMEPTSTPANTTNNIYQDDTLPNITTLNGLQYIRIPGTNTYQLLTDELFVSNTNSPPYQAMENQQINTLIDTKCLSPSAPTTTAIAADRQPLIAITTTAPASTCNGTSSTTGRTSMTNTTTALANGVFITQTSSILSRSPVPQATSSPNASSPSLHGQQQQQQQQYDEQRGKCMQPAILSPAANELLLQTCAVEHLSNNNISDPAFMAPAVLPQQQQQQLPVHLIKEEFHADSGDYTTTSKSLHSPTANTTLIYQSTIASAPAPAPVIPQSKSQLLNTTTLAISPPLEANTGATLANNMLPSFFSHQNHAFFQRIMPLKKELGGMLLDANTTVAGLTDEGMIEALDWWDAHTPKSDNGSTNM